MTRLFRSKSCSVGPRSIDSVMNPSTPHSPSVYQDVDDNDDEEEEDDEGYFGDFSSDHDSENPSTTPFISPPARNTKHNQQQQQFSVVALVAAALRRSLVTCSVEADEVASDVEIGFPTDVRLVSHVTFDRFNGFLGLPVDLQPDVPRKPPSASAIVFGVSAQSMQCSHDSRGNSVPTILLRMQNRLYSEGGLQAEGIFRINAENTQEEHVRDQLNRGVVPEGIDVHCLSGLIKAWFRELPSGVLDSLTPEQVMHCNTEEECTQLVKLLPSTEAALLDWAINLMADVAQHEHHNKMNARNIAMVFAPNMTQMADPLTALIHAVQVMNFLKTLIMKALRERQESEAAPATTTPTEYTNSVQSVEDSQCPSNTTIEAVQHEQGFDDCSCKNDIFWSFRSKSDVGDKYENDQLGKTSPVTRKRRTLGHSFKEEYENMEAEGILNRLSWRKGMQKLRRRPMFQLTKTVKKNGSVEL